MFGENVFDQPGGSLPGSFKLSQVSGYIDMFNRLGKAPAKTASEKTQVTALSNEDPDRSFSCAWREGRASPEDETLASYRWIWYPWPYLSMGFTGQSWVLHKSRHGPASCCRQTHSNWAWGLKYSRGDQSIWNIPSRRDYPGDASSQVCTEDEEDWKQNKQRAGGKAQDWMGFFWKYDKVWIQHRRFKFPHHPSDRGTSSLRLSGILKKCK